MRFSRMSAGRATVIGAFVAAGLAFAAIAASAAGQFPFDRELLLDTAPIAPLKRVPVLEVAADGSATIFLWCQTVRGRVQLSDSAIRIESGPLPDGLPRYMSDGQCTPERMQADVTTLAALAQVTNWQWQGQALVLTGPTTLKFLPSDH
jgi:heat shock protein HslJ